MLGRSWFHPEGHREQLWPVGPPSSVNPEKTELRSFSRKTKDGEEVAEGAV
jgi:hypothetical protein